MRIRADEVRPAITESFQARLREWSDACVSMLMTELEAQIGRILETPEP